MGIDQIALACVRTGLGIVPYQQFAQLASKLPSQPPASDPVYLRLGSLAKTDEAHC